MLLIWYGAQVATPVSTETVTAGNIGIGMVDTSFTPRSFTFTPRDLSYAPRIGLGEPRTFKETP